jgi:CNP1-like family
MVLKKAVNAHTGHAARFGSISQRACRLAVCGLLAGPMAMAADEDEDAKAWLERPVTAFPAAPDPAQMIRFFVSGTASQVFAIDAKSLSIGDDGVIRYTLVAQSASGVKNISYEGLRCASFEMKTYAYGRADGTWSVARRDEWLPIAHKVSNRPQAALALDYFCQGKSVAAKVNEIIDKMNAQLVK